MDAMMHKFFTPFDEIARDEPSYVTRGIVEPPERPEPSTKTPVMILDEGAKKIYEVAPTYTLRSASGLSNNPSFVMECKLREMISTGEGKTKKMAKHVAAAEMLKTMIRKDLKYGPKLGIPHSSIQESLNYIDSLSSEVTARTSPEGSDLQDFDRSANYIGQLQEMCQKNKLENPIYQDTEEGPMNDKTYIIQCKVGKMSSDGKGKKKKDAKAQAAYGMLKILEGGLSSLTKDFEGEDIDECGGTAEADIANAEDPGKSLEEILSNQEKFALYAADYKILERPCTFGMPQCLLKITIVRHGDSQESVLVFPGVGDTEDEARDNASRLAIENLSTY